MSSINYTAATLAVLEALARDPEGSVHTRKVAEKARVSVGSASMILRTLEASHLVDVEEKGAMKFYRINLLNPLSREFKILFTVRDLTDLVEALKDNAVRIVLFGSSAEGTDTKDSDVDLLILSQEPQTVKGILRRFQKEFARNLSPIIVGAEDLAKLRRHDKPLHDNISRGKVLWEKE